MITSDYIERVYARASKQMSGYQRVSTRRKLALKSFHGHAKVLIEDEFKKNNEEIVIKFDNGLYVLIWNGVASLLDFTMVDADREIYFQNRKIRITLAKLSIDEWSLYIQAVLDVWYRKKYTKASLRTGKDAIKYLVKYHDPMHADRVDLAIKNKFLDKLSTDAHKLHTVHDFITQFEYNAARKDTADFDLKLGDIIDFSAIEHVFVKLSGKNAVLMPLKQEQGSSVYVGTTELYKRAKYSASFETKQPLSIRGIQGVELGAFYAYCFDELHSLDKALFDIYAEAMKKLQITAVPFRIKYAVENGFIQATTGLPYNFKQRKASIMSLDAYLEYAKALTDLKKRVYDIQQEIPLKVNFYTFELYTD